MSVYTSGVFTLRFSAFINVVLPLTHLICRGYSQEAPTKQIVALLGDDVVLPCSLERPVDVSQLQLEWARTDLTPGFIYVWDKNKENVDDKQPSYVGRTSLSFDKLKHGDVSLTLSKVQLSDKGLYRCFIPELPQESFVDLVVGSFVVDVTQSSYQAEENHNITLEWTFTTKPDTSISALRILCSLNTDRNPSTLYHLHDGVKFSEDEEFSGRVQSDKDALREGRIRLQLSRLRTEDSGLYLCEVDTGYGRGYNSCRVTVSDFATILTTEISLQTPDHQDMTPTDDRSRVSVVAVVTLLLVALSLVLLHMSFVAFSHTKTQPSSQFEDSNYQPQGDTRASSTEIIIRSLTQKDVSLI